MHPRREEAPPPQSFYTVTAEIALARHQPRVAALQYAAAAAQRNRRRACWSGRRRCRPNPCNPSLAQKNRGALDPGSIRSRSMRNVRRRGPRWRCTGSMKPPLIIASCSNSPLGTEAEFAALETELGGNENIFGSRQLADRLARRFHPPPAALRVQGFTALRADDPAAAVQSFTALLALPAAGAQAGDPDARRELQQTLARARIMAGDAEPPLAQAQQNSRARRHARQSPRLCAAADDRAARLGGDPAIGDFDEEHRVRAGGAATAGAARISGGAPRRGQREICRAGAGRTNIWTMPSTIWA